VATTIRYADIIGYLTAIMNKERIPIEGSPHGQWWVDENGKPISYEAFTTGQVANVGIPIMDTQNPLQSAFYVILTDVNGFEGIPQMPAGGPMITDNNGTITFTLPDGKTQITGAEIAANMKSWLQNGFPQ
jgi:hypothetical protein